MIYFAGYITYKFTFNLTEPRSQNYQSNQYPASLYPGVYTACTPYVQSGNDLLRDTVSIVFAFFGLLLHVVGRGSLLSFKEANRQSGILEYPRNLCWVHCFFSSVYTSPYIREL